VCLCLCETERDERERERERERGEREREREKEILRSIKVACPFCCIKDSMDKNVNSVISVILLKFDIC
jgi:hypothetical protein